MIDAGPARWSAFSAWACTGAPSCASTASWEALPGGSAYGLGLAVVGWVWAWFGACAGRGGEREVDWTGAAESVSGGALLSRLGPLGSLLELVETAVASASLAMVPMG